MIKIGEAAKKLNVCVKTLQRWDNNGVLIAYRTPTNRRFYTESQLETFINVGKEKGLLKMQKE